MPGAANVLERRRRRAPVESEPRCGQVTNEKAVGALGPDTPPLDLEEHPVLVVDFGAQYAQLIARRVREANVYSEIVPSSSTVEEIAARKPAAVILSGGPSSVYAQGAPRVDPALFERGIPVFGICYGFQAMAAGVGRERGADGPAGVRRDPSDRHRRRLRPAPRAAGLSGRVDESRGRGGRGPARVPGHGAHRRTPRSPPSRTSSAGSPECSTTPRSCTRSPARRCCAGSCTTWPGSLPTGPPPRSFPSRSRRSAPASATRRSSAACPAAWTPPSPPRSCIGPSVIS